jgi:hypothetical protein
MLTLSRDSAVILVDGMVDPKDYEIANANCSRFTEILVGLAEHEEEKDPLTKLWPNQDSDP